MPKTIKLNNMDDVLRLFGSEGQDATLTAMLTQWTDTVQAKGVAAGEGLRMRILDRIRTDYRGRFDTQSTAPKAQVALPNVFKHAAAA